MARLCENGCIFFDKKEYENLEYKYLDRSSYRQFIKKVNARMAKYCILEGDGFLMPHNIGVLQIIKKLFLRGIGVSYKKTKEYNLHSNGYVYFQIFTPNKSKKITYSTRYSLNKKLGMSPVANFSFFKFRAHRLNINRQINYIVRNHIRDYPNVNINR